jgi:uncharacterized membrane protein YsdA (DUF1294 family)
VTFSLITLALTAYLAAVNAFTFAAFAYDKAQAKAGQRRVPERRLIELALIGGSLGALLAQQTLRHKTRKEPFRTHLILVICAQALVLLVVVILRTGA